MMSAIRYGGTSNSNSSVLTPPVGYTGILSFRNWFNTTKDCVRLKRVSDGALRDFGYKLGYLDTEAITIWAGGSEMNIMIWWTHFGNLKAEQYGNVPTPKLVIRDGKAFVVTSLGDGLVIKNIPHKDVKVTSAWKNTGAAHSMVGCYVSSLKRLQFTKYGSGWLLGVNDTFQIHPASAESLVDTHIVTYNSDDVNGVTKIYDQSGFSLTDSGNPTNTIFDLGVGMSDANGYYVSEGEINEIIIYHSNDLVSTVEQSLINAFKV